MKKGISIILISIVALFLTIQSGYASPALKLSDGVNTFMVVDEDPSDILSGLAGGVGFSGAVGGFIVNVSTGLTNPLLGSTTSPELAFSSIDLNSVNSGIITVMFTQTDFDPASLSLVFNVGGTTNGTSSFATYIDESNTAFGMRTLVANLGPFNNAFDGSANALIAPTGKYSITTVATIQHGNGPQVSSFSSELTVVPEPISYALFIAGGVVLGARSFFNRKK